MGAYHKLIPDNQKFVVKTTKEHWQAEGYLLSQKTKFDGKQCADYCAFLFAEFTAQDLDSECQAIEPFLLSQRVKMPKSRLGWQPIKLRLIDANWWTRQLKKRDMREAEQKRIASHKVQKYCSDALLNIMQQQKARLADWLSRSTIESSEGVELGLDEVAAKSIANPRLRRNELMVRIKGMEQHAAIFGHAARFITVTAPSKMHRSKGADWLKMTPKQVQNYLVETWSKVRAKLARQNINFYGLRVTEPHKDSCPHWHLLAWFESTKQAQIAVKTIRHYFLQQDGGEAGALFNRVKTITINPLKGGAAAYVAKYVCKNVDGAHMDTMTDRDGAAVTDGKDGAERVKAWASCWSARQFQFVGGAPIGLWRELRRIRDADAIKGAAWLLWNAADGADYCAFMLIYNELKGQGSKPKIKKVGFVDDLKVLAAKHGGVEHIPDDEIKALKTLNRYQEPTSKTIGVMIGDSEIKTRSNATWTIKTAAKKAELSAQDAVEAFAVGSGKNLDFSELVAVAASVGWFDGRAVGRGNLDLWQ